MNVVDYLLSRGSDSAPAVWHRDAVLRYGELRSQVSSVAAGLLAEGHGRGDRIGIFSENNFFFVRAYLGILHAGMVAVPFPIDTTQDAFLGIASSAGLGRVLVSRRFENPVRAWAKVLDVVIQADDAVPGRAVARALPGSNVESARDLAALMFTSGSTGRPKGVMITHRNIECNTGDIIAYLGLNSEDRVMVVLPFHYCFGLSLLHTHLAQGASLVLNNDSRLFPEAMLRELQDKECTGFAGVPSTYQILLRNSRFREMHLPRLRWLQQAGGKLPNPCIQEIVCAFPQVRYFIMYGQTEATARLSYLPPDRVLEKLGSIGQGLPSTRLEVIRADGQPVVPGSEETGEIVATGDNIAPGYWNDPVETAKYFSHGRLRTGDIARVDADGYIFVVERERELIKSGGNRVSAKEVEEIIAELPAVLEVAVVGVPHEMLGEAIVACVVTTRGADLNPQQVQVHCQRRLPASKRPEAVVFLQTLPHNSSGKILKPALKALLAQRPPAAASLPPRLPVRTPSGEPPGSLNLETVGEPVSP